jgi:hypothetical protein
MKKIVLLAILVASTGLLRGAQAAPKSEKCADVPFRFTPVPVQQTPIDTKAIV